MTIPNPHFEASYERIFGTDNEHQENEFFECFYQIFTRNEDVRLMFAETDMSKQIHMLKRSVFDLVGFYVTGIPSAEIIRLADIHRQLNIDSLWLDHWLAALVDTVDAMDPEADELARLGWMCAMLPGITLMRLELNK